MAHRARQHNTEAQSAIGLVRWRRQQLERAGFDAALADRLAGDPRLDLHAILDLTDRGCPPELAARILAPLDDPLERLR